VYYHNVVTNETSWELPSDVEPSAATAGGEAEYDEGAQFEDDGASEYNETPLINGEWREVFDEGSQRYYYHNEVTNETTWDRPAGNDTLPIQVSSSAVTEEIREPIYDDREGYPDDAYPNEADHAFADIQPGYGQIEEDVPPHPRGPSVLPDTLVQDLHPEMPIFDIADMFGSMYMEEFVEQNFNFARKGIFKAR
jgi:hypothetical protein